MLDLTQALADAKPNDTINLPAGRYIGTFHVNQPVTLVARGQVVLDAAHQGTVLTVATDGLVRLSGVMLVGGNATEAGGGVALLKGKLELLDCVLRFNKAPAFGGGGLFIRDGEALVQRCRFEGNTARQGGAILVDETGRLTLEHSLLVQNAAVEGGALRVKEAGHATVFASTLADNKVVGEQGLGGAVHLSGTQTRTPTVTLSNSIVAERAKGPAVVFNASRFPGTLTVTRSLLPPWSEGLGIDCLYALPDFSMDGAEPYLLAASSVAIGRADASLFASGAKDVAGRPRVKAARADLGAFASTAGGASGIGY